LSAAMAMPRWAYNPGTDRAPDGEPLESAKALVARRLDPFVPAKHAAHQGGLALRDGGSCWEAHEIWEPVWKAGPMNGSGRIALRTLIQIANAAVKQRQSRPRAAARLIEDAKALLGELVARGVAAEPESVAGRLRADRLRKELDNEKVPGPIRLAGFFSRKKMKENA